MYRLLNQARAIYWYIFRPRTVDVKCLIVHGDQILLVLHSYGVSNWTLPGGKVGRNELPEDAIKREVKEELNIDLAEPRRLGSYISTREYKRDQVYCYAEELRTNQYKISSKEIESARWFNPKNIPSNSSDSLIRAVEMYQANGSARL